MRMVLGLAVLLACWGCGEDKTVKVGADEKGQVQPGIALDTIQRAEDVAARANQRVESNERTLSGNR